MVTLTTGILCKYQYWDLAGDYYSSFVVIFCWRSRRTNFPQEEEEEEDGGADKLGPVCTERGSSQVKMMGRMIRTEIG